MSDPADTTILPDSETLRRRMVERQLVRRGISDPRVLEAMRAVPREVFVAKHLARSAYDDRALPIDADQTISQPYIVAMMAEAAALGPGDRVLEVGTGSGYAAAIFGLIAGHVFTIERHMVLADQARKRLDTLGYQNVEIRTGDGTRGWPEAAPFDAILVAASGPAVPEAWKQQLAAGGRLVMPRGGTTRVQRMIRFTRTGDGVFVEEDLGRVMFVPLVGGQD